MPGLDTLLGRYIAWLPDRELENIGGLTPIVVPRIAEYEFELPSGFHLTFLQSMRWGGTTELGSVEQFPFALHKPGERVSVTGVETRTSGASCAG